MNSIYEMFFLFLFWGAAGWLVEVVDMKIEAGEFQNRGFLHLPLCPLYGIGMQVFYMLLGSRRESLPALFVCGMLFCSLVEYLIGWALERLFHARWWDYSHMRFNIGGRVCLRNSILFGFGAVLSIGFIYPVVLRMIHRIPMRAASVLFDLGMLVLLADIVISVRRALGYRREACDGSKTFVIFKSHR